MIAENEESRGTVAESAISFNINFEENENLPNSKHLNLCMLSCEDKAPYGPMEHTANLFLRLLKKSFELDATNSIKKLTITCYETKEMKYPDSFQQFDGVILPGSISSAYDEDPWILKLKSVIRDELWHNEIPTLGVCFGHQMLAQSMPGGFVEKCPAGFQMGCRFMNLEAKIKLTTLSLCRNDGESGQVSLLCSHGDHVEKLPHMATPIASNDEVPVQIAAYFSESDTAQSLNPIFISLQAHPEYATESGLDTPTLRNMIQKFQSDSRMSKEESQAILEDIEENWDQVYQHSISITRRACELLQWI